MVLCTSWIRSVLGHLHRGVACIIYVLVVMVLVDGVLAAVSLLLTASLVLYGVGTSTGRGDMVHIPGTVCSMQ